jgi:hypothetical protein
MRKRLLLAFALLTGLALTTGSCGDEDVETLCGDYADKLVMCGSVDQGSRDVTRAACITVLQAGGNEASYRCVADASCPNLNQCGI